MYSGGFMNVKNMTIPLLMIGLTTYAYSMEQEITNIARQMTLENTTAERAQQANPEAVIRGTIKRLHDLIQEGIVEEISSPRMSERKVQTPLGDVDWDEIFFINSLKNPYENPEMHDKIQLMKQQTKTSDRGFYE